MNVAFEKVTKRRAVSIRKLAPWKIMDSVGDEDVHTLAAVNKDNESASVCGVIQYSFSRNLCNLDWIYVAPEFRGNGIGKAMVEYLYKEAGEFGVQELRCLIYQGASLTVNLEELSDFLLSAGFDVKDSVECLNFISGKDLLENFSVKDMGKFRDYSKNAVSFSMLTPDEISNSADALGVKDHEDIMEADRNLSCVYMSGGVCTGLLAFKKRGHQYSLSKFKVADETALKNIFRNTLYNSFKHLHVNDNILIELNKGQETLINRALPGIKPKDAVLVTKVL